MLALKITFRVILDTFLVICPSWGQFMKKVDSFKNGRYAIDRFAASNDMAFIVARWIGCLSAIVAFVFFPFAFFPYHSPLLYVLNAVGFYALGWAMGLCLALVSFTVGEPMIDAISEYFDRLKNEYSKKGIDNTKK